MSRVLILGGRSLRARATSTCHGGVQPAMRTVIVLAVGLFGLLESQPASAQSPSPVGLPGFHLTLREDPGSQLPLGLSCTGVAAHTLTCRTFVLTLENATAWTIYPRNRCGVPNIWVYRKEPRATGGWWPVSRTTNLWCDPAISMPSSSRLSPGEKLEYSVRLMAPGRATESLYPGSYTFRAGWDFQGCEREPCRTNPVTSSHPGDPPDTVPAGAVSNEIQVTSPQLPHLGKLKFSFDVAVRPGPPGGNSPDEHRCASEAAGMIDCVVFHYKIWNRGHHPVRNTTTSCSDSGITPEYRTPSDKQWKFIPGRGGFCSSNVAVEHEIFPGKALEGEFLLVHLLPGFDTTPLRVPGTYQFRFTFRPSACFASPDASFCLMRPDTQPPARSKELTLAVR